MAYLTSKLVNRFLTDVGNRNPRTADVYKYYLLDFDAFCKAKYNLDIDGMISALTSERQDVYKVTSSLVS